MKFNSSIKKLSVFIYFTLALSAAGSAQQWQWAKSAAGSSNIDRNVIITDDNAGNIYMTGEFEGTCTFGNDTLVAFGNRAVFVARFDALGDCMWAIQGGGTFSSNDGLGIATDNSGNVYVTGNFSNQIVFGGYTLNPVSNSYNSFIAKFDPFGNCQFLKGIHSSLAVAVSSLASDGSNGFLLTGALLDSTYFDGIGVTSINNAGSDIFLAKFDQQGNFIWVKTAGGISDDSGFGLTTDQSGNIFVTGQFKLTATFGTNTVTSYGDYDFFVAKFDNLGNNLWVRGGGASGIDQCFSVSTDGTGNSYITGYFYPFPGMPTQPAHFGPFLLPDNGAGNMFIAKYDASGTCAWAKHGGGSQHDEGLAISTDANGNSYVAGLFNGSATFGGIGLASSGSNDAFLVKYNSSGIGLFAQKIGGSALDKGKSLLSYPNGECILAGNFGTSVTVNTIPPSILNVSPGSQYKVFLVKYAGGSVGINDPVSEDSRIGVYPNPASDFLAISFLPGKRLDHHIQILNSLGQVVREIFVTTDGNSDYMISLEGIAHGSYVLRDVSDDSTNHINFLIGR